MSSKHYTSFLYALCFLLSISQVKANVTLPAVFSNHMVLQQNAEVKIWGWAKSGEEVTVTPSWNHKPVKTKASNLAEWEVILQTPAAGGPYTVEIKGYNTIKIEDVLLGEVWLCAGQSNMEWTARAGIEHAEREVPLASYPSIRFFSVSHRTADTPQLSLDGQWVVCTPESMIDFSAVGYFFGRKVHQTLQVPVGLINSSWGGTPAEAWVSKETIEENKILAEDAANLQEVPWGPVKTAKIYNAMIAPLVPYRLAGVLWYQGESNTGSPANYAELLPALIQNWRTRWNQAFPFYYVQIAPYQYDVPQQGVLLRDAQRRVLQKTENTGMVVVSDIGNKDDIHPRNKSDVGQRLADLALHKAYGKQELPASGPLYRSMKVEGNKVRLYFDYAGKGLVAKGNELTNFEIAGADQQFVKASAKIQGSTIVVQAKQVKKPVAVRFAWSNTAEPNLFNAEGLPASSFRTEAEPVSLK
ncbi:sialate O-acetylesterase [Pontibacter sp. SGAir0037]|uniref:sialate O-acetylesterase n=1 Tax=Pontibacter sp. SGAir0037 TaxID=2571030 RepID=UPI0010CCB356|nr:sialate O-acetylesterase [Pontibacter sp. SGAir0037]QCR22129.1 sialate O-acetylesterase [Pontibacter sp. SGAir0037]